MYPRASTKAPELVKLKKKGYDMGFPIVYQKDSMQCGIACLSMICEYFGRKYPLSFIERFCFATNEGVSLKGISDAAENLGLKSVGGKVSIDSLLILPLPCILHWNQNHFVVLYKVSQDGNRFWISDPARGKYKISLEEFKSHWITTNSNDCEKGIAMFFEKTDSFLGKTFGTRTENRSFQLLFKYFKLYRRSLIKIVLILAIGCILQLIMPFLTQAIVDIGIRDKNIGIIWLILLGELMIVIGRAATDFFRRWMLLKVSMRINISLVSDFIIKLFKLPMSFFDTKLMGDLLQRIGDHSRVQNFITVQALNIAFTTLSFIVFGIVLLSYNILIFSIFLIGSILHGLWIAIFLRRRKVLDYELFEQQANNQNKTFQLITSMQEIKLQNCEQRRRMEWRDVQANLLNVQMKSLKLQQTQEAGSIFINEMKNILITVLAATAVINGQITLGAMLAIQYIVGQLNSPVSQFMSFIYSLQDVNISLERINEIHEWENEESDENQIKNFTSEKGVIFDSVSFKYDTHSSTKILDNVSFKIPKGKVTAIVGASGSGKTTIIKLLLGYYPVNSGKILIAGRNLIDYNLKWWRNHCGVVMQDGVIFSESIARNIAIDDNEIDDKRLHSAAKIANIHEHIISLPLKYNTIIGRDGIGLSQGQKQRILIARAVYKNPDYIFLDEATNALDAKNEKMIVKNLDEFYKGRTVVVVAHRLSTVKNAHQIIVVDGGKIVELGNHSSLIKKKGNYFNLVKNQLELGI